MDFLFKKLDIPDVVLIECERFEDKRGYFSEIYKEDVFLEHGIGPFVQENYSCSIRNTLRGLHYQSKPMELGKLISCPHGEIFDVVVDIREGSPTFGEWTGVLLENGHAMLWVPPGFAHGFCVLSSRANVLYRQTQYYSKGHDKNIRWNDPDLAIRWPIEKPLISEKDKKAPFLKEAVKL